MSYLVPKEIPNCCGRCPCFHAERLMYCQAVKADKNKRIYAPYGEGRPDWCPLIEVPTPHGRLGDLDKLEKELQIASEDPYLKWEEARIYGKAISDVRVARTIIKAEGET